MRKLTGKLCVLLLLVSSFPRFKSDYYGSGMGFQLRYHSTDVAPQITNRIGTCGGSFTTQSGSFTSPSYPGNYPDNTDCIYTISQPNGTVILLNFVSMDIKYDEDKCDGCCDYLEIRDGPSATSPLLDILCGIDIPAPIQSSQSQTWLK